MYSICTTFSRTIAEQGYLVPFRESTVILSHKTKQSREIDFLCCIPYIKALHLSCQTQLFRDFNKTKYGPKSEKPYNYNFFDTVRHCPLFTVPFKM